MRIMSAIAKSRFDRMACVKARCDLEGILVSMTTKIALSRVDRMGPAVHAITRDSLTCLGVCGSRILNSAVLYRRGGFNLL